MKIILVVFLVTRASHEPLYYSEFDNLKACETARVAIHQNSGFYPLKQAYCMEFKK